MTDVRVKSWGTGVKEMALEDVLTPSVGAYETNGRLETAECLAEKNARMLGRLVDALYDKGVFTLEEALHIANVTDDVEPI